MKLGFFGYSLLFMSTLFSCECEKENERPDLEIPGSLNPAYFPNGLVYLANFNTPIVSYNTNGGCQVFAPGPFYLVGNVVLANEFYSLVQQEMLNGVMQAVTHVWNKNFMPPCFTSLTVGQEVIVYKFVVNKGNVSTKYSKKKEGKSRTRTVVIVKDNQGSRMVKEDDADTKEIPANSYALVSTRFKYDGNGLYEITVEADSDGQIDESDEANNQNIEEIENMME